MQGTTTMFKMLSQTTFSPWQNNLSENFLRAVPRIPSLEGLCFELAPSVEMK